MSSKCVNIKYEIKFLDYWHLGSGLSAGTKLDSLVIKDENGLPFAPGKTLKGLFREMAEEIDCSFVNVCFGGSSDPKDVCYDEKRKNIEGECYFTNATLSKEAIEQCKLFSPDLVLMDIMLKEQMSGCEAALQIKQYNQQIEIIFLSAFADREMIDYAVDCEACGYLMKPYRGNEIMATIRLALSHPQE